MSRASAAVAIIPTIVKNRGFIIVLLKFSISDPSLHVPIDERSAYHLLTQLDVYFILKNRRVIDKSVVFPIFAAGVDTRRDALQKRLIDHPFRPAVGQYALVHTNHDA